MTDEDKRECLKTRVYLAAKDGIAITLFTLISDLTKEEASNLLNEVSRVLFLNKSFVLEKRTKVVNMTREFCYLFTDCHRRGWTKMYTPYRCR